MDENKNDIGKMSDDEIKELLKIKWQESILEMQNAIVEFKSTLEKINRIRFKEVHEVYNKELNWFFAISVGTLLWILGNFDKFTIADGSMPYKIIYAASILFVGSSSAWLAKIQAEFFIYQHKQSKDSNLLIYNTEDIIKEAKSLKQYAENIMENFESRLFNSQSASDVSNELNTWNKSYRDKESRIKKSLDSFKESNIKSVKVAFSENKIIRPLILYIVGVFCFSAYIIIFIAYYV